MKTLGMVGAGVGLSLLGTLAHAQAADVAVEGIEVTANKRAQLLRDIDGAVSVRTSEELERNGVTRVDELEELFAGLKINTRGNRSYANVTVRGVTSPDFYNPAVQIYVDGVPQDPANFTQELFDVERVELLRGPQGTLYGRNAHGGVINIITRAPPAAFDARAAGAISTLERRAEASLSAPLVSERVILGAGFRWAHQLGQIDDIATAREDIDHATSRVGRIWLRYGAPGDPLKIVASAQRATLYSHEELYIRERLFKARQYDTATQGRDPTLDRDIDTYTVNLSYDFGQAQLSSVTGYQDRDMGRELGGRTTREDQATWSQEARLTFELGSRLEGLVGGFYQDADFRRLTQASSASGASLNRLYNRSTALFGETTLKLGRGWDLTAGLRYSREDAKVDFNRITPNPLAVHARDRFEDTSAKLAIGYALGETGRLYAVVSQGFKPGGYNHTVAIANDGIAYGSESSVNYEIGWRQDFWNDRLSVTAAAYWIEAKDKQIYVGPLGAQVLRNLGDARSRGVEIDARLAAAPGLSFELGLATGRSEFRNARDPFTEVSYDGNRLPYAPDTTARLAVRYVVPQSVLPGELSLSAAARHTSAIYFNETNTLRQSGYTLYDAAIDLLLDNGLRVSVIAENLGDEIFRTSSFSYGPDDVRSTIGEGQVIGAAIRKSF